MTTLELSCCCSRTDCAHLTKICTVVNDLERDVHEAGTLGQALLERYEQHVTTSEQERRELVAAMEALEKNKAALEDSNAHMINENRALLDQLEDLNSAVADSDSHIRTLNDTLDSTRKELHKLASLANKATQLERELTELEMERAKLDSELAVTQEEKHLARHRWKKAETTIATLQDQIDTMGDEAVEERRRHKEVVSRIKRQSEVNFQLCTQQNKKFTSGATCSTGRSGVQEGVVTSFVKDILQDNSQLQLGVIELREMLLASNSEVNHLRSQFETQSLNHQDSDASSCSLLTEMSAAGTSDQPLETVPELHVHHHYHTQRQPTKRLRKRNSITPSFRHGPAPSFWTGKQEPQLLGEHNSTTATIMSNTNVSVPTCHRAKWSIHSLATESSSTPSAISGSPHQLASIFDTLDSAYDMTRTTTPATSVPGSPMFNKPFEYLTDNTLAPETESSLQDTSQEAKWAAQLRSIKTLEVKERLDNSTHQDQEFDINNSLRSHSTFAPLRVKSHDSFMSVSGMDIHGPERMTPSSRHRLTTVFHSIAQPSVHYTKTMAAATTFSSPLSMLNKSGNDLSRSILQQHWQSPQQVKEMSSLKRMGGWVLGKWGAAPTSSQPIKYVPQCGIEFENNVDDKLRTVFRSPGINQPGPIFGIRKPHATPAAVQPTFIDSNLLQESLQD